MKVSICIPQYNRIHYLLKSLALIEQQTYLNIEITISDDGSTDETEEAIQKLSAHYKYPIVYDRNPSNLGYDRNYRKCIEMASGEYVIVIGNDDSIYGNDSIAYLVNFLRENNFPDIGFCNMIEERTNNTLIERATETKVIGYGKEVALKYYSCFSFVGGLIYKQESFLKSNTSKCDGSIYSQMYIGVHMVANGARLFSIKQPLVLKDILLNGVFRKGYRDRIAKNWKDFRIVDGGLPSVINVLISALKDSGKLDQKDSYYIFERIYAITYPHWILDYKENGALPEAVGLIRGLNPAKNQNLYLLNYINKAKIYAIYFISSTAALVTPVFMFKKLKPKLYTFFKR